MTILEICKDCKFNDNPYCSATILPDGTRIRIDNLEEGNFKCGLKNHLAQINLSVIKTHEEVKQERIEELENRLKVLEK